MRLLPFITCLLIAGCSAVPPRSQDNIIVKDNFFSKNFILYTGKHDIVKLFVPFNQFDFEESFEQDSSSSSSSSEENEHPYTVYFVEGDINEEKEVTYQGLYIHKAGKVTKLLDNGRDITVTKTKTTYFGAEDGIYKYDNATNTATKHGTVTDSIIQLAYNNVTNSVYYLTSDYKVYKLNEEATASVKVSGLEDVQEMVFSFDGKLYYYNSDKDFYVVDVEVGGEPRKIAGLPAHKNNIMLVAPLYGMDDGALAYIDEWVYGLDSDEAERSPIKIEVPITAAAPQATLIQFYAKDKKIYEFNILLIMLSNIFEGLREALEQYKEVISSVRKSNF